MKRILAAAAMLVASAAFADGRFSAADVPGAGIRQPGKVVIRNSGATITAYRFLGNISQALYANALSLNRLLAYGIVKSEN